jgi:trimeric autotransporter adhesin
MQIMSASFLPPGESGMHRWIDILHRLETGQINPGQFHNLGVAMKFSRYLLIACIGASMFCSLLNAQEPTASTSSAVVPRLVNFSGRATDAQGKIVTGIAGATFAIYQDQYEGTPLWMETQNVTADAKGNYTAQLGATKPDGLPLDLFATGEARWLGVRINGGEEQPRIMLLSVPYALKAGDAQTLGGLPASAFALATPVVAGEASSSNVAPAVNSSLASPATSSDVTTSGGTVNALPLFTTATNVQNSILTQIGSGTTGKIGINTATPASTLDINGAATVRGTLGLPATGAATATAGKNSQPLSFTASSFNSGTGSAVNQNFRWQAEPTGNNTASTSGTLNLLYAAGANSPAETGLKIAKNGQISFAAGQAFPGVTTSVGLSAPSSDFTVAGSPVKGTGTLVLDWTVAPTSNDVTNSIVKRDGSGDIEVNYVYADAGVYANSIAVDISAVTGNAFGENADGVAGIETGTGGSGLYGAASGTGSYGVYGLVTSAGVDGVHGESSSESSGVSGSSLNTTMGYGVYGEAESASGVGVYGIDTQSGGTGVYGGSTGGPGVYATSSGGWAVDAYGTSGATGVLAGSDTGYAGWFNANVEVDGTLTASSKDFKIDHPLDPANKYLFHASVESSEMMDIYTGNVTTDSQGDATVQFPDWFDALNTDFRYQLTVIGQFAQAIVAREIENHQFKIKTSLPNVRVSWQVTGVRQDAYAKAHPLQVEQEKPERERGFYIHPELYGASPEKGILWATAPHAMKQWQETREKPPSTQARRPPSIVLRRPLPY